jgi:CheY-like chemotaxis protein
MAHERPPDLIFLDLMLPDTHGFDVCRALKSHRQTAAIPIVVVTARLAPENRLECYRLGASDYLTKPYTPDQVFHALSAAQTWRRVIDDHAPSGHIRLETASDVEPFERIGWLQSVLLARTAWEEPEVARFGKDLVSLAQWLLDWGRRRQFADVGRIEFELRPDRFDLRVLDLVGWSRETNSPECQALARLAGEARFDSVQTLTCPEGLALTKQLAPR